MKYSTVRSQAKTNDVKLIGHSHKVDWPRIEWGSTFFFALLIVIYVTICTVWLL